MIALLSIGPWYIPTGHMLRVFVYRVINCGNCSKREQLWNMEMISMNIVIFHEERTTGWATIWVNKDLSFVWSVFDLYDELVDTLF